MRQLSLNEANAQSQIEDLEMRFQKLSGSSNSAQTEMAMIQIQLQKQTANYAATMADKMELQEELGNVR